MMREISRKETHQCLYERLRSMIKLGDIPWETVEGVPKETEGKFIFTQFKIS